MEWPRDAPKPFVNAFEDESEAAPIQRLDQNEFDSELNKNGSHETMPIRFLITPY